MTATARRSAQVASYRTRRDRTGRPANRLSLPPANEPFAPTLAPVARATSSRRSWSTGYIRTLLLADLVVGIVAALAASTIRFDDAVPTSHPWLSLLLPFAWMLALELGDGYERRYMGLAGAEEYRAVGRALLYFIAGLSVVSYLGHLSLSRGYVGLALSILVLGALLVRRTMRRRLVRRRRKGEALQRTLVIGRVDSATALVESISAELATGLRPVGACTLDLQGEPLGSGREIAGVPVVGRPIDAIEAVDMLDVEVVAVASHPDLAGAALRRLGWALEERGVDLVISPGLLDVAGPRMTIRPSTNLSLLHIERPTAARRSLVAKEIMDRILAAAGLLALSPLFLVVAALIKMDDRGPVFYRQERVGVRGELFGMFKFRSMRVGADSMVTRLADQDEGNGVLFKMKQDPRITRIGALLRRYSIDELPQLINVVRGEMSLVGPRPPLEREVRAYESDALRRLHVRPGMTGLWQVSGRSDLSWEESLKLDLRYVDNWSPVVDAWILMRTVRAVFAHEGAY